MFSRNDDHRRRQHVAPEARDPQQIPPSRPAAPFPSAVTNGNGTAAPQPVGILRAEQPVALRQQPAHTRHHTPSSLSDESLHSLIEISYQSGRLAQIKAHGIDDPEPVAQRQQPAEPPTREPEDRDMGEITTGTRGTELRTSPYFASFLSSAVRSTFRAEIWPSNTSFLPPESVRRLDRASPTLDARATTDLLTGVRPTMDAGSV